MAYEDDDDNKVGYGRPPKNKQFRKGKSGNPSGRPTGVKNIAAIVNQVCRERVKVKGEDGTFYYMPKMEVMITQLTNQAVKGDARAMRMCIELMKMFPELPQPCLKPLKLVISYPKVKDGCLAPLDPHEERVEMPLEEWQKLDHKVCDY